MPLGSENNPFELPPFNVYAPWMNFPLTLFDNKRKVPYIAFHCVNGKHPKTGDEDSGQEDSIISIAFPIPSEGLSFDHNLSWEEKELGVIAGELLNLVQESQSFEEFRENAGEQARSIMDMGVGGAASGLTMIAGRALANISEKITGMNLKAADAFEIGNRKKPVKNRNLLFGGASIRSFSFNFKLIPYSKEETEMCRKICNFFTANAYPERESNRFVAKYPPEWRIEVRTKDGDINPFMQKFDENGLQLTSVNIKYNSGADVRAYHKDGAPAVIDVSLAFKERRGLYRNEIEELLAK